MGYMHFLGLGERRACDTRGGMPEDLQLLPRPPLTAMQHGCRSQELLLEHEDPAEWRRLLSQYRNEYQPETEFLDQLMLEAAQAHWFFLRTQRNLFDTQAALPRNPMEWTDEHHRKLALFAISDDGGAEPSTGVSKTDKLSATTAVPGTIARTTSSGKTRGGCACGACSCCCGDALRERERREEAGEARDR